ncbi:hypothetical protein F5884DRAFT_167799 [Xylogone sp. PMI_703]|nr:hypothetical protein F5884DRAFT_167799 [Xylogone sp. PMI_703]
MEGLLSYLLAAFSFVIALSFVYFISSSRNSRRLLATPNIKEKNAVISILREIRINAPADEVFAVISRGKEAYSPVLKYNWDSVTDDGTPNVGSKGVVNLCVDGFGVRKVTVELTFLDQENRRIADRSTRYPGWLFRSETVQEVVPVPDKEKSYCDYRTWRTFEGIGSYFILMTPARIDIAEALRDAAYDLKSYMESNSKKPRRSQTY